MMIELLIATTASLFFGFATYIAFELHTRNIIRHERRDCAKRWREYYTGIEADND